MCDTFVATPSFTASGNMIFGKNSDREPNEAQALVRLPGTRPTQATAHATYIEVPQAEQTFEVLLAKPFHMWGAEMGANEHGVVMGNQAVFTNVKIAKKNRGLTGMDILRLTLERSTSARAGLDNLAFWIENYDQDACGGYEDRNFYYHNSFIIADAKQAFVVETAGRHWVAIEVQGFRSISNGLTIENEYQFHSPNLHDYARRHGLAGADGKVNFRRAFSDRFYTYFSKCRARQSLSASQGQAQHHTLDARGAMAILRTHNGDALSDSRISNVAYHKLNMESLCLHATGLLTPSQTTGSMVAEIRSNGPSTFWLTGTAAPCLSLFKPFFTGGNCLDPSEHIQPTSQADQSLWWRHERLHRSFLKEQGHLGAYQAERRRLETNFLEMEGQLIQGAVPMGRLHALSKESLAKQNELLKLFLADDYRKPYGYVRPSSSKKPDSKKNQRFPKLSPKLPFLYHRYWKRLSQRAGLNF